MTNREHSERREWKLVHGQCMFPDCERPSVEDDRSFPICAAHLEGTNAQADLEEANLAENVLGPWVKTCEAIGFPVLTRVMGGALMELRREKEELEERAHRQSPRRARRRRIEEGVCRRERSRR